MDIDMHNGQVGASYSGRDETIGRRSAFSRLSPSHSSHSMPLFFQQAWPGHPLPVSPMYISPALQQRGRGIVESHPSFLKVFVHNHNSSGTSSCHIEWDSTPGGVSKGVHISNPTGGSHTAGSHKVVDSERILLQ